MLPGSGLAIEKADWLLEDLLSAGAFVRLMKGCAELDGDFWVSTRSFCLMLTY